MREKKISNKVYYALMGIMIILFFITLIATKHQCVHQFIFFDRKDKYMDFFNSIRDCVDGDPYGMKCIYPPLTYLIYTFYGKFLPEKLLNGYDKFAVRDALQGKIVYYIYTAVIVVLMLGLIWRFLRTDKIKKAVFCVMMMFSTPVIYAFDRGNIVWLCMVFLMFYVFTYDHENRVLRELGLICLALATAIKIYPVVFGVLLLFDKRWKEAGRCILYGILIFFVPFFFFGGLSQFPVMLSNLANTSELLGNIGHGYRLNFQNTVFGMFEVIKFRGPDIDKVLGALLFLFYLFFLPCVFFTKERWKRVFLLTAILVGMPPFSYVYSMVFVIIPLVLFLNENRGEKMDAFYAVCFVFCFAPMGFNLTSLLGNARDPYVYTLNVIVMSLSLMLLTGFISLETWINLIRERGSRRKNG